MRRLRLSRQQGGATHHGLKRALLQSSPLPPLPPPPQHIQVPAVYEEAIESGGLTNVGVQLHQENPERKIATMVAGNSGRPGGACGLPDGTVQYLHAYHTTQEEDVVSNWLTTACFNEGQPLDDGADSSPFASRVYSSTIKGKWGMLRPEGRDVRTVQGVDYTRADRAGWYADAWVVHDASLSWKHVHQHGAEYVPTQQYPTALVFVAGPNTGATGRDDSSTTTRTFNECMAADYDLFRKGVKAALLAGLHAMAAHQQDVALLAAVSTGIYAAHAHRPRLRAEYKDIVTEVLGEVVSSEGEDLVTLGHYCERVVLTKLEP